MKTNKKLNYEVLLEIAEKLYYHKMKRDNRTITHTFQDLNDYERSTWIQLAELAIKEWNLLP